MQERTDLPPGRIVRHRNGDLTWKPDPPLPAPLADAHAEIARLRTLALDGLQREYTDGERAELLQLRQLVRIVHEHAAAHVGRYPPTAHTPWEPAVLALEKIAEITKRPPTER